MLTYQELFTLIVRGYFGVSKGQTERIPVVLPCDDSLDVLPLKVTVRSHASICHASSFVCLIFDGQNLAKHIKAISFLDRFNFALQFFHGFHSFVS